MDSYNNIRERKNKNKDRKKPIFPCSQLPIILLKQTNITWTCISHCTLRLKAMATLTRPKERYYFKITTNCESLKLILNLFYIWKYLSRTIKIIWVIFGVLLD